MTRTANVFTMGEMSNAIHYNEIHSDYSFSRRPDKRQKIRGINFGIASRAGKALRTGLKTVIPFPTDRNMQNRLSGAIAKWLRLSNVDELPPCDAATHISRLPFTSSDTFNECFKVPLTVSQPKDDIITVTVDAFVPALKVAAPENTIFLELVIAVAGCILKTGMAAGSVTQRIQVPYHYNEIPAQVLQFNIPAREGRLTVTAAWLQYFVMKNNGILRTENPSFMPAGIINARYSIA